MEPPEFKSYLEGLRKRLSEAEYFEVILDHLDKDPPADERGTLEDSLVAFSSVDPDRAARYWGHFLSSDDAFLRESTAMQIALLVQSFRSPLAYRLLADFLGEEPAPDKLDDILRKRMLRLFPGNEEAE
jgi:hypothetical protein